MHKKFGYILFFSLFLACSSHQKQEEVKITPISNEIQISELSVDSIPEGCFTNGFIIDSMLFLTATCDENKIHVYNTQSAKLIKKFGTSGQASFEVLDIQPFTNNTLFRKNNAIQFFDFRLRQEKSIFFNNILSGKEEKDNILSTPKDEKLISSRDLTYLDETLICGSSVDEFTGQFFLYDMVKKDKKWIPYNLPFKEEKTIMNDLHYGMLNANPSKNTIIFAFTFFDQVLFYDFNGNLKKEYYFSEQKRPEFSTTFTGISNGADVYATAIYSTKDYFYVYRILQSMDDVVYSPKESSQILVFTSDGDLERVFRLSLLPSIICVDEDNKILYAIKSSEEEHDPHVKVIKYAIKEYL